MAHRYLRVEIHNHGIDDYENLHEELAKLGYYRVIRLSDFKWYDLPTGEYHKNSNFSFIEEDSLIQSAIKRVLNKNPNPNKDYYYVLTDSVPNTNVIVRLKPNTDKKKLPIS